MANYKNIGQEVAPVGISTTYASNEALSQAILDATDWTQLPDSGLTDSCKASFVTYRAAIRTIRQTNPASPTWPDAPTEDFS
tara:strand:+ start:157 stop:402 length:246 start_codon:yes stop_codon:yes gene_type:complete